MFLSKTLYPLLSTCSTQEDPSQQVDWNIKNQHKLFKLAVLVKETDFEQSNLVLHH